MVAGELPEEIKTEPFYAKAPVTVVHGEGDLIDKYGVSGVPHTFYFDKGGRVALELDGYSESYLHQLEERLAKDLGSAARGVAPPPVTHLARR